jgi:hypothetical protein
MGLLYSHNNNNNNNNKNLKAGIFFELEIHILGNQTKPFLSWVLFLCVRNFTSWEANTKTFQT